MNLTPTAALTDVTKLALLGTLSLLFCCVQLIAKTSLADLQVNYQDTPMGIDEDVILFSWHMTADSKIKALKQTAYQISVSNEAEQVVWNTDRQQSGTSVAIRYAGDPLQARMRYQWTVTVWTSEGEEVKANSWFETGLRDPNLAAWNGATWIGGAAEDMVLAADVLTVFKINYDVQIDAQSTKASFLFGGNDIRLQHAHLNMDEIVTAQDESFIEVELDISDFASGGQAAINFYRRGFVKDDNPEKPIHTITVPTNLINASNQHERHTVHLHLVFGRVDIFLDGEDEANWLTKPKQSNPYAPKGLNLNPYGSGNDFITFPVLGDIGFKMNPGQQARYSKLQIRHFRKPSNVIFQEDLTASNTRLFDEIKGVKVEAGAYRLNGGSDVLLALADPSRNTAPMLRTGFAVERKTIAKARLYATARGIYDVYLNGKKIGKDFFNPGLTQYDKHQLYQTFDVTGQVQSGKANALGTVLGEGWWSGNATFRGENWNYFGDRQSFLAQLIITYTDGSEQIIATKPADWQLYTDGPLRNGSFFQGATYDATKETAVKGWTTATFDASSWKSAVAVPLEGTAFLGDFRDMGGRARSLDYSEQELIGQTGKKAQHVKTLQAQKVEEVRPLVYVYDMGQNMVGVPRIQIRNGTRGDTVIMRFAEVRYPDLEEYKGHEGMIMLENIRAALAHDFHILKGGDEVIEPKFTFHGYRFVEVSGVNTQPALADVEGIVISSVSDLASHFECSNPLVNQLWSNVTWSLRSNFLSIPTDCPARNERMGWNGDINVFSRASTWLADVNPFLDRHLMAMRDMQQENGRYSDVAPIGNGFGGTLWGSAGLVIPWELYQHYGDIAMLAEHYPSMKAYVDYLSEQTADNGAITEGPLGDWLSPENTKNDNALLWTAYHVYDIDVLRKAARVLGKVEDAARYDQLFSLRQNLFNELFVDPATGKTVHSGTKIQGFGPPPNNPPKRGDLMDTQASYAVPLALGVFTPQNAAQAAKHLAATVARRNVDDSGVERPPYSLMTGFIGTASIGEALTENGEAESMYRLLQAEDYPSWLYPVKNGATTIWERLNSYTIEDGFGGNNNMNSFNHYSFGAVASWMYNYSLGIQRGDEGGFKTFKLEPVPDPTGQMTYAKGHYDSMYGRIESAWEQNSDSMKYRFTVPANTTAEVSLVASSLTSFDESGNTMLKELGIVPSFDGGRVQFSLPAGSYIFQVKL